MEKQNETSEIADTGGWTTESESEVEDGNEDQDESKTAERKAEVEQMPRGNSKWECLLLGIVLLLFLVHHLNKDYFHFYVWTIQLDLAAHKPPRPLKTAWWAYNVLLLIFSVVFYVLLRLRAKSLARKRWQRN